MTGIRVRAHHGVFEFEREQGQEFVIDVSVAVDLAAPDGRDDYIRVRLESAGADLPIAHPQRGKSVALSTIARADGLVRVVAAGKGFHAGDEVEVLLLD